MEKSKLYKNFVDAGLDDETKTFYNRDKQPIFFGKKATKEKLLNKLEDSQIKSSLSDYKQAKKLSTLKKISRICADFFGIHEIDLFRARRGVINEPRKIAIYGSRVWALEKLSVIAETYNCCNHSSISNTVKEIEMQERNDKKFKRMMEN